MKAEIIAEVLRKLAQMGPLSNDALYEMAEEIESSDFKESQCCSMCDEVICDKDCPCFSIRKINEI